MLAAADNDHGNWRVLIVEDNEAQRITLCDLLGDDGFMIHTAGSAGEALAIAGRADIAVAVVDLRLPDLSGTEFLRKLREVNHQTRVIIHTGYGSFDSARDSVNLGAFAYVEKMGDPGELIRHVHRAVRERISNELTSERSLLKGIVDTVVSAIIAIDSDGRVSFANRQAERILGLDRSEILGRRHDDTRWNLTDLAGKPLGDKAHPFKRVMDTGEPVCDVELVIEREGGHRSVLLVNSAPLRNKEGEITRVVCSIDDITRRKQAEAALRTAHDTLEDQVRTRTADLSAANRNLESQIRERQRAEDALRAAHDGLELRVNERTLELVKANDDLQEEIQERRRAETRLSEMIQKERIATIEAEESQHALRNILESISDGFVALDHRWRYTYVNRKAAQLLGRDAGDLIGKAIWEEFPEGIGQPFYHAYYNAAEQKVSQQIQEYYPPWGRWFDNRVYPSEHGITVFFSDVTESKLAERQIQKKNASLRLLQVVTASANEATDVEQAIQTVLDEVCRYTHWPVGHAYILDPKDKTLLRPTGLWHTDDSDKFTLFRQTTAQHTFRTGVGLPGRVHASGCPAWIVNVHQDDNFLRARKVPDLGVRAAFGFPVLVGSEVVAVLEFYSTESTEPDESLLGLMTQVGTQVGRVIERTRAQEQTRKTERLYHQVLDAITDLVVVKSRGSRIRWANRAFREYYGILPGEETGSGTIGTEHPEYTSRYLEADNYVFETGQTHQIQAEPVKRHDNEVRLFHTVKSPIFDDHERVDMVVAASRDITERQRAKDVLAMQSTVLEKVAIGAELTETLNALCLYVERLIPGSVTSVMELDEERKRLSIIAAPSAPTALINLLDGTKICGTHGSCAAAVDSGEIVIVEDTMTDPRWADARHVAERFDIKACWSIPIRSHRGQMLGSFGISHPETKRPNSFHLSLLGTASHLAAIAIQRRRSELGLKHSEERYRNLFEQTPIAIWEEDFTQVGEWLASLRAKGVERIEEHLREHPEELERALRMVRIRDVNEASLDMFESESKDQLKRGLPTVFQDESHHGFMCELQAIWNDHNIVKHEAVGATVKGERRHKLVHWTAPRVNDRIDLSRVIVAVSDITELKRAEEALRTSEVRYRSLYNNTPVMMHSINQVGELVSVNDHWLRTLGYERDEVLGRRSTDFLTDVSRRYARDTVLPSFFKEGSVTDIEYQMVKKDGQVIDVLLSAVTDRSQQQASMVSLAFIVDVTERKHAEQARDRLEAQLRQSQKLEAVGTLASGVAHDFNNLVTAINAYTDMAKHDLSQGHPARESLNMLERVTAQASSVTQSLLRFAHETSSEKEPVNVSELIVDAVNLLRPLFRSSIQLVPRVPADGGAWVMGDRSSLQQVVMNLALNGGDAMPEGGRLQITLSVLRSGKVGRAAGETNAELVLTVEDAGTGMAKETVNRIFEPFFTTKSRGEGTGLGLAVVHGIIQEHRGRIAVDSKPGRGTRFNVYLPCCEAPKPIEDAPQHADDGAANHGKTLLIIEDQPHLRSIMASSLATLGFVVQQASNMDEATNHFNLAPYGIDLAVVDLNMPEDRGTLLIDMICHEHPKVPVIVVTEDGGKPCPDGTGGMLHTLVKPFSMSDLADLVRHTLKHAPREVSTQ